MLFNSVEFLIFFPIVLLMYFAIPKKLKNLWLLLASYFFYMCWNARYIILIFASTVITYFSGICIEKCKGKKNENKIKKIIVLVSVFLNLANLVYFKYSNFFITTLIRVCGKMNIALNIPVFDIILPVGISFYTFQALSYTIDVYRNDVYAEKNFINYALFVSFFPQLVAGPIERSKNLLKQLNDAHKFDFDRAKDGILLMIWGFFLKLVLADRIAVFVNAIYGHYTNYGGCYLIVATILFGVQIYCDFAGYSTIAKGASEILGINLMENFDAPYLSVSVSEFWKKWHISLTSWFKDYVYIPLGGNRKGKFRKYLNKMIVFLLSGLWHGASFSYIVWGFINGLYQIVGEILLPIKSKLCQFFKLKVNSIGHKLLCMVNTFILIDFSWIFFRAPGLQDAVNIIKSIITVKNPWVLFDGSLYNFGLDNKNWYLMILSIGILIFADFCKYKKIKIRKVILEQNLWFRCLFFALSIWAILMFGIWGEGYNSADFIYFQF